MAPDLHLENHYNYRHISVKCYQILMLLCMLCTVVSVVDGIDRNSKSYIQADAIL